MLVLLLLLTSCIKYEGTIKIEDDGSGTVTVLTAVNPEAFEVLEAFAGEGEDFGDAGQICDDFNNDVNSESDVPEGGTIEAYNEDGFCGATVRYPLAASDDHSAQLGEFLDDTTRLYRQGDNWIFETDFSADEITGEAEDLGDDFVADLFGDASFQITVDLPGRAVGGANNADQVGDDGVFRWNIDLLNPPARLFAQTEPGSGGGDGSNISADGGDDGGGISPILIGVIVALLAAGLAFFLWNKKKQENAELGDTLVAPAAGVEQSFTEPGATMVPSAGAMPVTDGPAITATPPTADSMKETVVLSAAGIADAVAEAEAPATPQPVFDEELQAWVVDDPARGRLRHDPATDTWNPI